MSMQTTQYLSVILNELHQTVGLINDQEVEEFVDGIMQARKIFVAGAGRSGFMIKSFAMRMMHIGLEAYAVGETITPRLEKEDLLIIASGSGETKSLVSMAQKAKDIEGKLSLVTINPESTIGKLAKPIVKLPGSPKEKEKSQYETIQPMASLFEQTLLLLFDSVILKLMEKKGLNSSTMFTRHANLE